MSWVYNNVNIFKAVQVIRKITDDDTSFYLNNKAKLSLHEVLICPEGFNSLQSLFDYYQQITDSYDKSRDRDYNIVSNDTDTDEF